MIVIGFTGSFGSGCTETIKLIKKNIQEKCIVVSLSDFLRDYVESTDWKQKVENAPKEEKRGIMQSAGNAYRSEDGASILADKAIEKIQSIGNDELECVDFILVDSIRNVAEIDALRDNYKTYIWAIYANLRTRQERMKEEYNYRFDLFNRDDLRDHEEQIKHGQQVDTCVDEADIMTKNEKNIMKSLATKREYFEKKINPHLNLILNPKSRIPRMNEVYMTMAYSMAAQSRCLQRKVGALITSGDYQIVSLGHNDIPKNLEPCIKRFGGCNRKRIKSKLLKMYTYCPKCGNPLTEEKYCEDCNKSINEEYLRDKNLGACRSLHAEESAIVGAAKSGIPLNDGIIFTTTFPCNLCANKIANVGLKKVVYVEPYPQIEAIETLKENNVELELFEGIKSRAFFDLFKRIEEIERLEQDEFEI